LRGPVVAARSRIQRARTRVSRPSAHC
jgi:hypothetical protein